jgi:2-polyprenyl-3-methyl-5-hydroxy-6-metoxy-1,4-benzoquinol methylase
MTKSYLELLEETLPSPAHKNYKAWKQYALTAITRGLILRKIISKFVNVESARVLDVGCGDGGISIAFCKQGKTEMYGIDINPMGVYKSKVRAKEEEATINFLIADGLNLPFKLGAFDVVICNDVMEHVPKPRQLAKEVYRSLKNGGFLYLSVPNGISPDSIIHDAHYGLFVVSLMPHRIGKFYLTKIRKISEVYDVYGPFNYWLLRMILKGMFRIVDCYHEQPSKVEGLVRNLPDSVLRFVYPTITLICEKIPNCQPFMRLQP